jgi:hypothetical protein
MYLVDSFTCFMFGQHMFVQNNGWALIFIMKMTLVSFDRKVIVKRSIKSRGRARFLSIFKFVQHLNWLFDRIVIVKRLVKGRGRACFLSIFNFVQYLN